MIDITWGPQYAVGHEMIDHQHQVFVDLIRSSSGAIDSRRGEESVRRSLEELALYARFHFFSEQSLMINSDYPDTEAHTQEHARVLSTFEKKMEAYSRDPGAGDALIMFIFEWLIVHTLDADKKLAEHLRAHR